MKLLSFLVLLPIFAYASADISQFRGQFYKKAEYDVCLKNFDVVTQKVNAVQGYTVLSGGCLEYGKDTFRMEFDYLHPLASYVENYPVELENEKTCQNYLAAAQNEMVASGNQFVTAYCQGKVLNTHFIDTTRSIVRSLNRLGKFNSLVECSNFLADLTNKASALRMTSFMSLCIATKYDATEKVYYRPVFNYISYYETEMGLITGKLVPSVASCANNMNVEQNFSKNNVKVVHSYCSGTMSWEQTTQETVLYLKPNSGRYIAEYSGVVMNSKQTCETQLENVIRGIESTGEGVLYGFCQKVGEKHFKPSVTYIKTIKI